MPTEHNAELTNALRLARSAFVNNAYAQAAISGEDHEKAKTIATSDRYVVAVLEAETTTDDAQALGKLNDLKGELNALGGAGYVGSIADAALTALAEANK
jgi:hypothetical protein